MIQAAIKKAAEGEHLTGAEMTTVMNLIMEGRVTEAQTASFLTALCIKGETVEEITAAARVMRAKAVSIPVESRAGLVDIVGTGGDMSGTFNISTAAAIVAAGAGLKVAKHGNRAATSRCGSADVVEQLGVSLEISAGGVGRCIDEIGIGFLYARNLHQAMKHAAGVRKEIGIRTVFNLLGPLTNPADAEVQLIGVYKKELVETLCRVLEVLGRKRARVVHGLDGMDEISLCADTAVCELKNGKVRAYELSPLKPGMNRTDPANLKGGNAAENAAIITAILKGEEGPRRDIVCINAGAAIELCGMADTLEDGARMAAEAIDSGRALEKIEALKRMTAKLN